SCGVARTLSARRTSHCASSVCTLFASSSMPNQRSLRISLTISFDFLCSDETSGGFCCLRDIKTSSCFHCLLITERCDYAALAQRGFNLASIMNVLSRRPAWLSSSPHQTSNCGGNPMTVLVTILCSAL